jgi:hypothetical protein
MTRTYELRTPVGKRAHMVFECEDAARRRMAAVASRMPLELVEITTTRTERVIATPENRNG